MAASKKSNRSISQVDEIVELPSTSGAAALEKRSNPFNRDTKPLKRHSRSMSVINFFEKENLEEVPSELATPKTLSKNPEKKSNKKKETYKFYVGLDEYEDSNSMPGASAAEDINQQFVEANNEYAELELRASREEQRLKLQQRSKSMPEISCRKNVAIKKSRKKETYKFYIDLHEYNVVPSNEEEKLTEMVQPCHEVTENFKVDTEKAEQPHGTTEMRHRPDSPIYDTIPTAYAQPLSSDDVEGTPFELQMRREEEQSAAHCGEQGEMIGSSQRNSNESAFSLGSILKHYSNRFGDFDKDNPPSPNDRSPCSVSPTKEDSAIADSTTNTNGRAGDSLNPDIKNDGKLIKLRCYPAVAPKPVLKELPKAAKPTYAAIRERGCVHIKFGVMAAPSLEPIPRRGWVLQQIGNFNK